jgi:hypothetical protein
LLICLNEDICFPIIKFYGSPSMWNVQAKHPGQVHVEMEKAGQASRWNTLRVLRVFQHFNIDLE